MTEKKNDKINATIKWKNGWQVSVTKVTTDAGKSAIQTDDVQLTAVGTTDDNRVTENNSQYTFVYINVSV